MKIENFDTGLKGQKDIKNLIISPEENYINKKKVREYLNNICLLYTSDAADE